MSPRSDARGLPAGSVFALAIDASAPRTLYAGTASGPYRSTDGGGSWSAANSGVSSATVVAFAFDRGNSVLYAGTGAGVFSTTNGGASWTPVNAGLGNLTINALVSDSNGTLYAATDGAGVFRLVPPSPAREPVQGSRPHPPPRSVTPRP